MAFDLLAPLPIVDTPSACLVDITPPTFAGIATLVGQLNGSGLASWLAATDTTGPVTYLIYVQKDTATGLFSLTPLATQSLSLYIFQDSAGNLLGSGDTYFVGVRARDGVGNVDNNIVSLSFISSGVYNLNIPGLVNQLVGIANAIGGQIVGQVEDDTEISGEIVEGD